MYVFESLKRLTYKFTLIKKQVPGTGSSTRSRKSIDDISAAAPEILAAAIPQGAVQYHESSDKWVTYYKVDGTDQFVGIYPNEYEAQVAYVEYERVQSTKIVSTPSPSKNILVYTPPH